jgi:hypothetical protein
LEVSLSANWRQIRQPGEQQQPVAYFDKPGVLRMTKVGMIIFRDRQINKGKWMMMMIMANLRQRFYFRPPPRCPLGMGVPPPLKTKQKLQKSQKLVKVNKLLKSKKLLKSYLK